MKVRLLLLPLLTVALVLLGTVNTASAVTVVNPDPGPSATSGTNVYNCDATAFTNCHLQTTNPFAGSSNGTPSAFGCRWVDSWATHSAWTGFVNYRYHNLTAWCWAYGVAVYNHHTYGYMDSGDGFHTLANQNNVNYDYQYFSGYQTSGWYSRWYGQVSECFINVCSVTSYPWAEVRAHGDGTWYSSHGGT